MALSALGGERLTGSSIRRPKLVGQDEVLSHCRSLPSLCLIWEKSITGSTVTTANSFCKCPMDILMTSCVVFLEILPIHSVQRQSPEPLSLRCDAAHLQYFSGSFGLEVCLSFILYPAQTFLWSPSSSSIHCLDCSQKWSMRETETEAERHRERQRERQGDWEGERQRPREREREREAKTERHTKRETETERKRQRDQETERRTERETKMERDQQRPFLKDLSGFLEQY